MPLSLYCMRNVGSNNWYRNHWVARGLTAVAAVLVYQGQQEIIGSQLGEGKVHRGTFQKAPAAIKLFKDGSKAFDQQMRVFNALHCTPHPNITTMLGIWPEHDGGPMCLATQLCDCSLETLLYPETMLPAPPSSLDVSLMGGDAIPGPHRVPIMQHTSLQFAVNIAIQIAQGLAYLHPTNNLHLNLKPSNVLLRALPTEQAAHDPGNSTECLARALYARMSADQGNDALNARTILVRQAAKLAGVPLQVKLADFGLPQKIGPGPADWPAASLPYLAPELIQHGDASTSPAADTYALGVLLWEMLHRHRPYHGLTSKEILAHKLQSGSGLAWSTPQHLQPASVRQLVALCVHPDPAQRPTASSLVHQLGMLQLELLGAARAHMAQKITQAYTASARAEAMQGLKGQGLQLNQYGIPDWQHEQCSLLMLQPGMCYQSQLGAPDHQQ